MRLYMVLAVGAVVAHAVKVADLEKLITWPIAISTAIALPLIPYLLQRSSEVCCGLW